MLGKTKKLTKKQIKEDKLVTSFYEIQKYYDKYQNQILIAAGAVAVIIVAIFWYSNKMAQDNLTANTELSRVLPSYDANNYQEAIDGKPGTNNIGLKKIVDEYGSADQGELAKIYIANCYYFLGDIEHAKEYYDDYSGSTPEFEAATAAGLAACFESEGDIESAAEYYRKAAFTTEENAMNPEYLLKAGKCYFQLGDKEEAKTLFDLIIDKYRSSSSARLVSRYTSLIDN